MKRLLLAGILALMLSTGTAHAEDFWNPYTGEYTLTNCAYYADSSALSGFNYYCQLPDNSWVRTSPSIQYTGVVWGG